MILLLSIRTYICTYVHICVCMWFSYTPRKVLQEDVRGSCQSWFHRVAVMRAQCSNHSTTRHRPTECQVLLLVSLSLSFSLSFFLSFSLCHTYLAFFYHSSLSYSYFPISLLFSFPLSPRKKIYVRSFVVKLERVKNNRKSRDVTAEKYMERLKG